MCAKVTAIYDLLFKSKMMKSHGIPDQYFETL